MIIVMTNDGLIHRKVYVAVVEHSRSRATMQVQFDVAISYAAEKLEMSVLNNYQWLAVLVIVNQDMFISNFHTAEF